MIFRSTRLGRFSIDLIDSIDQLRGLHLTMLQYYTVHMHAMYSQTQNNTYTKMNLSTVKWIQWDKTQSRELFICVCSSLCTIVAHNTAQNRPDNFPLALQTITTAPMMSIWGKGGQLFQKRSSRGIWHRFLVGQMPFLSPNQQWQST